MIRTDHAIERLERIGLTKEEAEDDMRRNYKRMMKSKKYGTYFIYSNKYGRYAISPKGEVITVMKRLADTKRWVKEKRRKTQEVAMVEKGQKRDIAEMLGVL